LCVNLLPKFNAAFETLTRKFQPFGNRRRGQPVRRHRSLADAAGAANGKIDAIDITSTLAPLSGVATAGNKKVTLNWQPIDGAVSYNVYRGNASTNESLVALATNVTGNTYTDLAVTNGSTYYYEVSAVGPVGESVAGNQVKATPLASLPAAEIAIGHAEVFNVRATIKDDLVADVASLIDDGNLPGRN